MDTFSNLPVMDVIAGFIVVLIGAFVFMAILAWQQCKRANRLAAELHDAKQDASAWAQNAMKYFKQASQLKKQQSGSNEND